MSTVPFEYACFENVCEDLVSHLLQVNAIISCGWSIFNVAVLSLEELCLSGETGENEVNGLIIGQKGIRSALASVDLGNWRIGRISWRNIMPVFVAF